MLYYVTPSSFATLDMMVVFPKADTTDHQVLPSRVSTIKSLFNTLNVCIMYIQDITVLYIASRFKQQISATSMQNLHHHIKGCSLNQINAEVTTTA
jgi:hypothetical protein